MADIPKIRAAINLLGLVSSLIFFTTSKVELYQDSSPISTVYSGHPHLFRMYPSANMILLKKPKAVISELAH